MDALLDAINIEQLKWMIPVTLFAVTILQILYLVYLNAAARSPKTTRQPIEPVMPTSPYQSTAPTQTQSGIATHPPSQAAPGFGHLPPPPTPAMAMPAKFVVLTGLPNRPEITVPGNNFGIGRFYNPQLNILVALDERSVSRRHATFTGDERLGEYYLIDTNSSYGTHIRVENHFERIPPGSKERVYNEDIIQFGNIVKVRLVLPCDTRASATRL
jgi:hypothetical protein